MTVLKGMLRQMSQWTHLEALTNVSPTQSYWKHHMTLALECHVSDILSIEE